MILLKAAHTVCPLPHPGSPQGRLSVRCHNCMCMPGGHRSWHEHLDISNLLLDRLKHKCALKVSVGRESGRASLAQKVPDCTCCPELQSSRGSAQEESASRFPSKGTGRPYSSRLAGSFHRAATQGASQNSATPHTNRFSHVAEIVPTEAQVLFSEFPVIS